MRSEALDRIDWAAVVRKVLDRHPGAEVPDAAVEELGMEMRERCQAVFSGAARGIKRSVDKHVALGMIRHPEGGR